MPYNMTIEVTSGLGTVGVDEDVAAACTEAYEALSKLPVNRQCVLDFDTPEEARSFVRQGKAWAAETEVSVPVKDENGKPTKNVRVAPLVFARKGNVKENPTRVSFRIYPAAAPKDDGATAK